MRIVPRNHSLRYPRAVYREKQELVLDWLLEFRFSSFALLAQRLGLTCQTSYKFFRSLRDTGLVQRFAHDHYKREQYYMLTRAGAAFLHEAGRDTANACTAPLPPDPLLIHPARLGRPTSRAPLSRQLH